MEVGPDVQRAAARVIDGLKRRVEQSAPRARVSWVKPERLHVTVRFIGELDPTAAGGVLAALRCPLAISAFDLTITGTGCFPPSRPPRVVWAGVTAGLAPLLAVEREVRSRLDEVPLPGGDSRYHPHLTLARVRHPAGLRSASLLEGFETARFGTVRVEAVTLFESRVSPLGYVPLGRTWLRP